MERKEQKPGRVTTPYDELTYKIIGLAMAVHKELGPGFPEKIYQRAMGVVMEGDKLVCAREFPVQVMFREQVVGKFASDLVIENKVILELKALETLATVHTQQMVAYLTASGLPVGLLINFGAA